MCTLRWGSRRTEPSGKPRSPAIPMAGPARRLPRRRQRTGEVPDRNVHPMCTFPSPSRQAARRRVEYKHLYSNVLYLPSGLGDCAPSLPKVHMRTLPPAPLRRPWSLCEIRFPITKIGFDALWAAADNGGKQGKRGKTGRHGKRGNVRVFFGAKSSQTRPSPLGARLSDFPSSSVHLHPTVPSRPGAS
jgi:hypothetical protein